MNVFRRDGRSGHTTWRGNGGGWLRTFSVVTVEAGRATTLLADDAETFVVPLAGHAYLEHEGVTLDLGARDDVFAGVPEAIVVVPPGVRTSIAARLQTADVAVIAARGGRFKDVVRWVNVVVEERGKETWRRVVHTIVGPDGPGSTALIGETITPAGNWSSFPPHKHDTASDAETQNEEIYYFRTQPRSGFGMVRLYSPERGVDEAYTVYDGDVLFIPHGYHTVAAAPGYDLYYLWALAGPEKALRWKADPEHAWIDP